MKFEMTREGCVLATDYLKKVDQYDAFMRNGWSVDGFSLIAWANTSLTGDSPVEATVIHIWRLYGKV